MSGLAHQSRQVVNRNDGTSLADTLGVDINGRFWERGVDIVHGDRVVWVRGANMQCQRCNSP